MTTITASTTIGVYLSSPAFTNPVAIIPGITITGNYRGDAIYANAGFWTISNAGTISGVGSQVGAIYLGGGGVVTNQATGVIGLPFSNYSDIYITGGAGTVTNAGIINAGVWLQTGGSVTNQTGGRIISGDPSGGYGVGLLAGGTVANAGLISGLLVGIDANHLGGTVTNQAGGTITGHYVGVAMGIEGLPIEDQPIAGGRFVINQAGGTISGDIGVLAAASSATVTNAGVITGTFAGTVTPGGITLVVGAGVSMSAGGAVTDQLGGTIIGASDGVYISSGAGTVVNYGDIGGGGPTGFGVGLLDGGLADNAATGLISAAGRSAVYFNGAAGTVFNAGQIVASGTASSRGVALYAGGYLSNAESGTISATGNGNAVRVQAAAGTVVNAGTLINDFVGRSAVALQMGGSVTNVGGGVIHAGAWNGIYGIGGAVTVVNAGAIFGGGSAHGGIQLLAGGEVTNTSSASLIGPNGIDIEGGPGTVVNDGQVVGSATISSSNNLLNQPGRGVYLASGGAATNAASGTISGGYIGVELGGGSNLLNYGSVTGMPGLSVGVVVTGSGGSITNAASGLITGNLGILVNHDASATIVNAGKIVATGPDAKAHGVALFAVGAVTNSASASITGSVFGVYLYVGGTLTNAGTIIGNSGTAVAFGGTGSNQLALEPGFGFSGTVDGSASASNVLELASAASAGSVSGLGTLFLNFGSIEFDTGADWFIAGDTAGLAGTISGFALGDTIEVSGIVATGVTYASGVLQIGEASGTIDLKLPGTFTTTDFAFNNVAAGADITIACFRSGTRISTARGEVAVERLRIGEMLPAHTGDGRLTPHRVEWIGHRAIDCRRHPEPALVWPVRIAACAFGPGRPHCDLFLSPDHAVFVVTEGHAHGVLIPIRHLLNGASITQQIVDSVTYWHVELSQHAVLLAEGLMCETYLDTGQRHAFANGGAATQLHPDFATRMWEARGCARLVCAGHEVELARRHLHSLAPRRASSTQRR